MLVGMIGVSDIAPFIILRAFVSVGDINFWLLGYKLKAAANN
jgi:hypothetical protein